MGINPHTLLFFVNVISLTLTKHYYFITNYSFKNKRLKKVNYVIIFLIFFVKCYEQKVVCV